MLRTSSSRTPRSRKLALVLLSLALWLASCRTPCPRPSPVVVTRREPCLVAPPEDLLAFTEGAPGCPAEAVCFDAANAARLAVNLARLISRVQEDWARCKVPIVPDAQG